MSHPYRTTPFESEQLPPGIPYIIGNEVAERFSFYGMKTILFAFMTQYLLDRTGNRATMNSEEARACVHFFISSAYFTPFLGAILSDTLLGKYRTIISLSVFYCLGHLALALDETRIGLFLGLGLIALGAGGIKPCVTAHVGDQFGEKNKHLITKVFGWFYFSINFGAFTSTALTPKLLDWYGPHVAFGVPGVLMLIATLVFWLGRHRFVHIPAGGVAAVRQAIDRDGLRAIGNLLMIFVCVSMFWSLFDQTGSAWIQQANRMELNLKAAGFRFELLPSQIQAVNPLLVLAFIPLFLYVIYPAIDRVFRLTPLRKIGIGLFVTIAAFSFSAWIEGQITGGEVLQVTSEADPEHWGANRLLDNADTGAGWISRPHKAEFVPQEIVFRLRERRAWRISSVTIDPTADVAKFLAAEGKPPLANPASCQPREVEIFVGETRRGDPISSSPKPQWQWSRLVGRVEFAEGDGPRTVSFTPVETEFLMLRVKSNHGGPFAGLRRVHVLAEGELPPDSHPQCRAVWPDVAAAGFKPHVLWQAIAYILLTGAEVMVSITALEFYYTQAPNKLKSFLMSLNLLSVSAGNLFTGLVNHFIQKPDGGSVLEGAAYYWFFTAAMTGTAFLFLIVAKVYRGRSYIQGQE